MEALDVISHFITYHRVPRIRLIETIFEWIEFRNSLEYLGDWYINPGKVNLNALGVIGTFVYVFHFDVVK